MIWRRGGEDEKRNARRCGRQAGKRCVTPFNSGPRPTHHRPRSPAGRALDRVRVCPPPAHAKTTSIFLWCGLGPRETGVKRALCRGVVCTARFSSPVYVHGTVGNGPRPNRAALGGGGSRYGSVSWRTVDRARRCTARVAARPARLVTMEYVRTTPNITSGRRRRLTWKMFGDEHGELFFPSGERLIMTCARVRRALLFIELWGDFLRRQASELRGS